MREPRPLAPCLALAAALAARAAVAQGTLPTGFTDQLVVGGLDEPVGMGFLTDGRLLLVEQRTARIRLVVNDALSATDPVGTVDQVDASDAEEGLLGIAVDPGWPARPYLYVFCNDLDTPNIRISRYTVAGDLSFTGNGALGLVGGSRYDVLRDIPDLDPSHNGGTLRFGTDGMLYASIGEDYVACAAQDTVSLRGVILRLRVDGLPAGGGGPPDPALITPPGNPFLAHPDPRARLVWALGLRNPFRFHVDPADGALFVADVGLFSYEEIDRVAGPGLDLGWPLYEGPAPNVSCNVTITHTGPIHWYYRGCCAAAVIGAGVYRVPGGGGGFPSDYDGDCFFSDYYMGFLRRLEGSGSSWSLAPPVPGQPGATDWGTGFGAVSDWLQEPGPAGRLHYCRQSEDYAPGTGQIRRIVADAPLAVEPPPPRGLALLPPAPSPSRGAVRLRYALPREARVELEVLDARGRRVRRLMEAAPQPAGRHEARWDGRDRNGRAVPSGIYLVRLTAGDEVSVARVPIAR